MNILALDIGTSLVKAAVLNAETNHLGPMAQTPLALESPGPEAFEVSTRELWRAVAAASRAAVQQAGVSGKTGQDVAGVGLSCFLPGLVLLDRADKPLRPIWTPLDRRARTVARQAWSAVGEEFLNSVGSRPLPGLISVLGFRQLLTLEPYLLHDVRSYLHANGWLAFHMTGQRAFDPGNASATGLFGTLTDRQWSGRWCEYFEVEKDWLPPVVSGNAAVGTLRAEVAAELGVPAGLPVKLGGDSICSAVLAAGMATGDLLHILGQDEILAVVTESPVPAPQRVTRLLGVGNAFIRVAHNPVGGVALEWLRRLCFREQTETEFLETTVPLALGRTTRVSLDPPFLVGAPMEIEAYRAGFRDLELTTDRLDLLAALLQAMVRRYREGLEALGQGRSFRRIFLMGEGAEIVRRVLPGYRDGGVQKIEEGSLQGVGRQFLIGG